MWPWTLGPLPPWGPGALFGYALHHYITPVLNCDGCNKHVGQRNRTTQLPDHARHLSFDSMLAEPVIPALPVSQQLQVALCVELSGFVM